MPFRLNGVWLQKITIISRCWPAMAQTNHYLRCTCLLHAQSFLKPFCLDGKLMNRVTAFLDGRMHRSARQLVLFKLDWTHFYIFSLKVLMLWRLTEYHQGMTLTLSAINAKCLYYKSISNHFVLSKDILLSSPSNYIY